MVLHPVGLEFQGLRVGPVLASVVGPRWTHPNGWIRTWVITSDESNPSREGCSVVVQWPSMARMVEGTRTTLRADGGPAAALALLMLATARADRPIDVILTLLLVVLPLAARRTWPLAVLLVVAAGSIVLSISAANPWVEVVAVALASFTVGERSTDRTRSALTVLLVATALTIGFVAQDGDLVTSLALPFVVLIPAWVVGDLIRARRADAAARVEAVARDQADQEARIRTGVERERRHVARELHDVVAHGVSVMLVQAGAARQVVRSSPEAAEASLLAVEASGRDAMAELRRLLDVLGDDPEAHAAEDAGRRPQPGIDQLGVLVDRLSEAGLPTRLEIEGDRRTLPSSIEITAYRIVQEALTNALRYAGQAATLVLLAYDTSQLRIEVLDEGVPAAAATEGGGRGLVGMRERAAIVGGRLEAGPRLGGGYAVRAWLPLDVEPR